MYQEWFEKYKKVIEEGKRKISADSVGMVNRILEINNILEHEKEKCSQNEIDKLEFEKEIIETYLI